MILCVNSIYVILEYNQVFNLLDGILETELWQNENSEEVNQEHTEECSENIAVQEVDDSENEIQDADDSEDETQDVDDFGEELQDHHDFENSQAEIQDVDDSEEDIIQDIENSDDGIQKKMEVMEVEDISD